MPDRWHELEVLGIFSKIAEVVVWRRRSVWGRLPRHVASLVLIRVRADSCWMFLFHRNEVGWRLFVIDGAIRWVTAGMTRVCG